MPRETFERELQELKYQLLILGSMVEQADATGCFQIALF